MVSLQPVSNWYLICCMPQIRATSGILGAFITGLLSVAKQRKTGKIEIQGEDGKKLIIPADTSLDRIDQLLERIKKMDSVRIHLSEQ